MAQTIYIEKLPTSVEKTLKDSVAVQKRIAVALERIANLMEPERGWSVEEQDKHIREWMKKESEAKRDTGSGDSGGSSNGVDGI